MSLTTMQRDNDDFARDAETVGRIVSRLLRGAHLTAVYVTGDFRLEFARAETEPAGPVPLVTVLTLRSDWRIGDSGRWEAFLGSPVDFSAPLEVKREAMKAYGMVCLYRGGAEVADTALSDDGTLVLSTSMGVLVVPGKEEVFEESWVLEVPGGVPNNDRWSVVCTNTGELFGRPRSA